MGIEDGACLAECLSRATNAKEVPRYLRVFEQLRKPRCEKIQLGSRSNGDMWHLQDGLEQESRDRALSGNGLEENIGTEFGNDSGNGNPWSNKDFQPWLFGHDVFREANEALNRMGQ